MKNNTPSKAEVFTAMFLGIGFVVGMTIIIAFWYIFLSVLAIVVITVILVWLYYFVKAEPNLNKKEDADYSDDELKEILKATKRKWDE